jgi:hypothetical protein
MTFADRQKRAPARENPQTDTAVGIATAQVLELVRHNRTGTDFESHVLILLNVLCEAKRQIDSGAKRSVAVHMAVSWGTFVVSPGYTERVEKAPEKARAAMELVDEEKEFAVEVVAKFIRARDRDVKKPRGCNRDYYREYGAALDGILEISRGSRLKAQLRRE